MPIFLRGDHNEWYICLDDITIELPQYLLKCVVQKNQGFSEQLPSLPINVGREVDIIMIGSRYTKYFPEKVAGLESGLT